MIWSDIFYSILSKVYIVLGVLCIFAGLQGLHNAQFAQCQPCTRVFKRSIVIGVITIIAGWWGIPYLFQLMEQI